ncbi:uncharacterized protein LOC123195833 isoform X3 [Mangifera indica]|uniref:uncharacterized protein LOC123195833 isoform X3 n=1 Tax=Mangifera indica TaxID=29780 RepID=UPI001CFAC1D8|nr:uncharacterized protein LOC123195833 isoform X3 [Mangifera indica]
MEAISIGSDPRFYFQVGKIKINEGMKSLQDLVYWCKDNLSSENDGILHEAMTYFQSLQRQIQEIEFEAQQGRASGSFNLQRGQTH